MLVACVSPLSSICCGSMAGNRIRVQHAVTLSAGSCCGVLTAPGCRSAAVHLSHSYPANPCANIKNVCTLGPMHRVAARVSLLFGPELFDILPPRLVGALEGYGGTLAPLSPTAAEVVAAWLRERGRAPTSTPVERPAAGPRGGATAAMAAAVAAAVPRLGDEVLDGLMHLLVGAAEQAHGGGDRRPVAWSALVMCRPGAMNGTCVAARRGCPRIATWRAWTCIFQPVLSRVSALMSSMLPATRCACVWPGAFRITRQCAAYGAWRLSTVCCGSHRSGGDAAAAHRDAAARCAHARPHHRRSGRAQGLWPEGGQVVNCASAATARLSWGVVWCVLTHRTLYQRPPTNHRPLPAAQVAELVRQARQGRISQANFDLAMLQLQQVITASYFAS